MSQLCSIKPIFWCLLLISIRPNSSEPVADANDEAPAGPPNLVVLLLQGDVNKEKDGPASLETLRKEGVLLDSLSLGTQKEVTEMLRALTKQVKTQGFVAEEFTTVGAGAFIEKNRARPMLILVNLKATKTDKTVAEIFAAVKGCYLDAQTMTACIDFDATGDRATRCVLRYPGKFPSGQTYSEQVTLDDLRALFEQLSSVSAVPMPGQSQRKLVRAIAELK